MIVASGNVVHNLRRLEWTSPGSGFDWARRFDDAARDRVRDDPSDLGRLRDHPDYAASVPTPEHFLPLAYLAGVATRLGAVPNVLIDGCSMGSLSMMAYILKPAATESSVRSDGQEQH
jgi:4,5-DOPA dioxygenase extradiol